MQNPLLNYACQNLETIINWTYLTYIWINKKLEYRFLAKTTKIENIIMKTTSFPCKTAMSQTNIKTNRMGSTKSTYKKQWSFPSNYLILLKILFQFKNLI